MDTRICQGIELNGPTLLFLHLWQIAVEWSPDELSRSIKPEKEFVEKVHAALLKDDAELVAKELCRLIGELDSSSDHARGRMLSVMQEFDLVLLQIHPRSIRWPAKGAAIEPMWLIDAAERRLLTGQYDCMNKFLLVARGPLLRLPREPATANAECLADRFCAASVVRDSLSLKGFKKTDAKDWLVGIVNQIRIPAFLPVSSMTQ
jgi:hypothetical protein